MKRTRSASRSQVKSPLPLPGSIYEGIYKTLSKSRINQALSDRIYCLPMSCRTVQYLQLQCFGNSAVEWLDGNHQCQTQNNFTSRLCVDCQTLSGLLTSKAPPVPHLPPPPWSARSKPQIVSAEITQQLSNRLTRQEPSWSMQPGSPASQTWHAKSWVQQPTRPTTMAPPTGAASTP